MRIWPKVWHHIREGTERYMKEELDSEESRGAEVWIMYSDSVYHVYQDSNTGGGLTSV